MTSPQLWSTDNPYLYKVVNRLLKDNKIIDEECISIGIRNIAFSAENGFHLNGKSMKLKVDVFIMTMALWVQRLLIGQRKGKLNY